MNNENQVENNVLDVFELTEQEKEEGRQNGIIIVGKTGVGKTTLINMLFNKAVGKVQKSAISCTQISTVYYYKLKSGQVICLIDTPGLADSSKMENKEIDRIHLEGISEIISKVKIHIKGILFLVNFQEERFDADVQHALLEYNRVFPLKDFWKSLCVIFTHFFKDEDEEKSEEELIRERSASNAEIFSKLMDKVKNVSQVITYDELKKKYFNSHSDPNNKKKKKRNDLNRAELEILLADQIKNPPLFHRVEVKTINNHKWKQEVDGQEKEYIGEVKIVSYFDFNEEPLKETIHIISKKEVQKNFNYPAPSWGSCWNNSGGTDSSGNIIHKEEEFNPPVPPDDEKYSNVVENALTGALVFGTAAGFGCIACIAESAATGVALSTGPVGWVIGGAALAGAALFGWLSKK